MNNSRLVELQQTERNREIDTFASRVLSALPREAIQQIYAPDVGFVPPGAGIHCKLSPRFFMPNADTHDRITYIFAPVTFAAVQWYWQLPVLSLIATAAMLFAGLMFGPDLDLHSRPYRRWGPLRFIWKPYQAALSHRSTFSHGPVLGTIVRLIYFLAIFTLLGSLVLWFQQNYVHGVNITWQEQYLLLRDDVFAFWRGADRLYLIAGFFGLCFGAFTHTAADVIWSALKPRKRRRR